MEIIEKKALTKEEINKAYYYEKNEMIEYDDYNYKGNDRQYSITKYYTLTIWTNHKKEVKKVIESNWFTKKYVYNVVEYPCIIKIRNKQTIQETISNTRWNYKQFINDSKKELMTIEEYFKDLINILDKSTANEFTDLNIKSLENELRRKYNEANYLDLEDYQQHILTYLHSNDINITDEYQPLQ